MSYHAPDHSIEILDNTLYLKGTFRLKLPINYAPIFMFLKERIANKEIPILNIKDVLFFNSAGIVALAAIIISARDQDMPITIYYDKDKTWQRRSIVSLERLWEKMETKSV
jgi:hypothetical protein